MVLPELLREIENRGVQLVPVGNRLRFRPKRNLTPELVEGLRQHKAEILRELEERNRPPDAVKGGKPDDVSERPDKLPGTVTGTIETTGEVLEMARTRLREIAPEYLMDPAILPPEKGGDPLVHTRTAKARFFRGARARDLRRREREGLPPWIRVVDGCAP